MGAIRVLRAFVVIAVATVALFTATSAQAALQFVPAYQDSLADPVSGPIYVTAPPGDSTRLFVVERGGYIRVAVNGVMQDAPFLDIHTLVNTGGEGGLLSMAFAPDYAISGKFYVYYVEPPDMGSSFGDIQIDEFQRSVGDPNVANPAGTPILEVAHDDASNHYGGQLQFGPDNKLYAGTGDGGGGGNQYGHAQVTGSNLGKLLAIDPAGPTVTQAGIGLRNPFRFSFDSATGDLVIGDVGQAEWEEVDWVPAGTLTGLNFGWACYEGYQARSQSNPDNVCQPGPLTSPVLAYANPNGGANPPAAITGGVVVRDPALGALFGRYVYADYYAGQVRSLKLASPNATEDRAETDLARTPLCFGSGNSCLVAFGQDADHHVYVVTLAGPVYRIACSGTCDAPPTSGGGGGGGGGGGTTDPGTPPTGTQPAETQPPATTVPPATPAVTDRTAPRLTLRGRRIQRLARSHRLRLSALCSEDCTLRVTARGSRTLRKALDGRRRETLSLRSRLHRTTRITILVRATDAAGNASTRRLSVLVML